MGSPRPVPIYLEVAKKRTFAGAVEWPGWCRSGRDETSAIEALLANGPRYARVLRGTRLGFTVPSASDLEVVERLEGDASTEFGVPGIAPSADRRPMGEDDLRRSRTLLSACWRALDRAVEAARGADLRKGPRGGGRDLDAIVRHVTEAETGYLSAVGRRHRSQGDDPAEELGRGHDAVLDALTSAVREGVPERGPRGGSRWTARYFVRRVAWHALDHAWEIEDRSS